MTPCSRPLEIVNGISLAALRKVINAEALSDAIASFDEDLAEGRYVEADVTLARDAQEGGRAQSGDGRCRSGRASYPDRRQHVCVQNDGVMGFNPAACANSRWRVSNVTKYRSPSSTAVATWSTSRVRQPSAGVCVARHSPVSRPPYLALRPAKPVPAERSRLAADGQG
jgi:hypothetical protein